MTHTITAKCTRQGDCVEVCPVDCIVAGPTDDPNWNDLFFIAPDDCIDCGACVPVCPPEAIFPEDEVPPEFEEIEYVIDGTTVVGDTARNEFFFTNGPGYWEDHDFEEERQTYKGETIPLDERVSGYED
jgi:ferredoxin--NADP+ reductase